MPTTTRRAAARTLALVLALLTAACEVGLGEATDGGSWTGSVSLTIEREKRVSEPSRQLDDFSVDRGAIPSLQLVPVDLDETRWRAELDDLTVTCTRDYVSVDRKSRDEIKVVSKGEVSGPAAAEVSLFVERDEGVYRLSVDFFGPPLPIRIEQFRNGVSERVQVVDDQECSFRHDVTQPLPSPVDVLAGSDTSGDPPWSFSIDWRLERSR